jgi:hypothetical protein
VSGIVLTVVAIVSITVTSLMPFGTTVSVTGTVSVDVVFIIVTGTISVLAVVS